MTELVELVGLAEKLLANERLVFVRAQAEEGRPEEKIFSRLGEVIIELTVGPSRSHARISAGESFSASSSKLVAEGEEKFIGWLCMVLETAAAVRRCREGQSRKVLELLQAPTA